MVAELAGCSVMSASRALNGVDISSEVAERVKQAAATLGYVPNVSARRLRGGRTRTVGLLMNVEFDPRTEVMASLDCLIHEMEQAGHQVLLSFARGDSQRITDHLEGFLSRGVDGLFFWQAEPSRLLAQYRAIGLPIVAIGSRHEQCSELPLVTFDTGPAFAEMGRRMRDLGHRDAFELTSPDRPALHEVFDVGTLSWARYDVSSDTDDLVSLVESLRTGAERGTLVLCDYPWAIRLLQVCEELEVSVPDDLSVISFVDAIAAPMLRTPLSSLHSDYDGLGVAAAQSMLAAIEGASVADVYVPDSITWIERASTGPAPRR